MKKIFLVSILSFFLSGCWMHYNDPTPPGFNAKVTTVNNDVCVLVQPEDDEKLVTLIIMEVGNKENILKKFSINVPVSSDKCIPTYGYHFEAGKRYTFDIFLESENKLKNHVSPAVRVYGTSFILQDNNGRLASMTSS